ncbi:dihydrodipicolinate synthase family protein [Nocardia fluminea]|uniref:dihydrodipicolinate synthase family protein n=1 Tax=Nocardia fluminea TaxID=134984 RepID=UPI00366E72EE
MNEWSIIVPALHIPRANGGIDLDRTLRYAEEAAASWVDQFLINGSTTGGRELPGADREAILDIWLDAVGRERLLACSWSWRDIAVARERGVMPMAVMTPDFVGADVLRWFRELTPATIYSHPVYGGPVWTPELARTSAAAEMAPLGGKVSKVDIDQVRALHAAAPEFSLWDGSARHICESLDAGASGVVLTPLAGDLHRLPSKTIHDVQKFVNIIQAELDQIGRKVDRQRLLLDRANS